MHLLDALCTDRGDLLFGFSDKRSSEDEKDEHEHEHCISFY